MLMAIEGALIGIEGALMTASLIAYRRSPP